MKINRLFQTELNWFSVSNIIMMANLNAFFFFSCKQSIRANYLVNKLMEDTDKINRLAKLGLNWFSISDVIVETRFTIYTDR